jgi:hypothetical protein
MLEFRQFPPNFIKFRQVLCRQNVLRIFADDQPGSSQWTVFSSQGTVVSGVCAVESRQGKNK